MNIHHNYPIFLLDYMYMLCLISTFCVVAGPPAVPTGPIKCTQITRDSVTIQWKAPKEDGGSRVTGYIVEKKEGLRHTYVHVSKTLSEETTLTVLGLNEGKDYYFRVYAENKYGRSPALESKEPATPKRTLGICAKHHCGNCVQTVIKQ